MTARYSKHPWRSHLPLDPLKRAGELDFVRPL